MPPKKKTYGFAKARPDGRDIRDVFASPRATAPPRPKAASSPAAPKTTPKPAPKTVPRAPVAPMAPAASMMSSPLAGTSRKGAVDLTRDGEERGDEGEDSDSDMSLLFFGSDSEDEEDEKEAGGDLEGDAEERRRYAELVARFAPNPDLDEVEIVGEVLGDRTNTAPRSRSGLSRPDSNTVPPSSPPSAFEKMMASSADAGRQS